MSNTAKLLAAVLMSAPFAPAQDTTAGSDAPPSVLQRNEGEIRTRRPREGVASPSRDFIVKIGPKTNGSKHLLVVTEEIPPGAAIPRHKHRGEDEIVLIQTGSAHVWLGDKEYDAQPGALIFIPSGTWISLKNTGKENISVVAVWNEPGFEGELRCVSVPKGEAAKPQSREEVRECFSHGDAELDIAQPQTEKKP